MTSDPCWDPDRCCSPPCQTKQRAYVKDIGFSFSPFLPILGTGLVTADGELWRTQRLLLGPALRTDMLDEVLQPGQDLTRFEGR